MQERELVAFIVLSRPDTPRELNWEDSDLLKTCGRQAASYLTLLRLSEALADARQFEAFNRLSAYVVHDLKNLAAQLSLVVSNARRHMHSPGFVEDAIDTVDNATRKMNRMLAQLRKELLVAERAGKGSALRFLVDEVEIELQLATTSEDGAGGGVKFWVFNAEAKVNASEANTQKLKLKLKPVGPDGQPVKVSDVDNLPD